MRHNRLDSLVLAVTFDEINLIGLKFPAHELAVRHCTYKKVFARLKHSRNRELHLLFRHLLDLFPVRRYLECSDGEVHAGREDISLSLNIHDVNVVYLAIVNFLASNVEVIKHDHESRHLLILCVFYCTKNSVW